MRGTSRGSRRGLRVVCEACGMLCASGLEFKRVIGDAGRM